MSRLGRLWSFGKALALFAGAGFLAGVGWRIWAGLVRFQPLGIDFMPMWAAGHAVLGHPHRVYDVVWLTHAQRPMLGHFHGLRPFVYPPSSLLVFAPLSLLPFGVAYAAWTVAGTAALVAVMARLAPRPLELLAMLLTPASVLVLNTGQTTFLVAAMAMAALAMMEKRPILAGVLFGVTGAIKPQAMVLLPVALIAARQWRAIAATALAAAAVLFVALVAFGGAIWFEWQTAMGAFGKWVMSTWDLERGMITPTALGLNLRLDQGSLDAWRAAFGLGAIAMAAWVFRSTDDVARRGAALLGGGLFVTPYAMHYDAALLAPAAALMLARRPAPGSWIIAFIAGGLLCCAAIPDWGAAGVTAFTLISSLTPANALAAPARAASPAHAAPQDVVHGLEGVDRA